MATFNVSDADKYGGQGGGGYFSLKDDGDSAEVQFMYKSAADIMGCSVHQVQVGDKSRYVDCLRSYGEPMDKCPFCANQNGGNIKPASVKFFIPVWHEGVLKTWERGKAQAQDLMALAAEFGDLSSQVIKVVRKGRKGDTKTGYTFIPKPNIQPEVSINDVDVPNPVGTIVLSKSVDDMDYYVAYGKFPSDDSGNDENSFRRRGNVQQNDRPIGRRAAYSERDEY